MKPPFSTDLRFRFGSARRAAARWGAAAALAVGALFLGACASRPDLVWTEDGRQFGKASWYDDHGDRTANGERFNMHALTAAHPSLALNSLVEVTNLRNGRTITVRINDRLPTYHERVIDLSMASFRKLDDLDRGLMDVELRVIRYGNNRYAKTEAAAPDGKLYLAGSSTRTSPARSSAAEASTKTAAKPTSAIKPATKASAAKAKPVGKPAVAPRSATPAKGVKPSVKQPQAVPRDLPNAAPVPSEASWQEESALPEEEQAAEAAEYEASLSPASFPS